MILIDEHCHRHILSDHDAAMLAGALRASYVQLLDAWGNRAGAAHGYNWPAREPVEADSCARKADRIEAICEALGHPIDTSMRRRTEEYYAVVSEKWWTDHLLDSHGQT